MIALENITLSYGDEKALDNVSLSISQGSTLAIIGHSGCGKTTLLNVIAGLLHPTSGTVCIEQPDCHGSQPSVGLIMQSSSLYPWMTVFDNVAVGLRARKLLKNDISRIVDSALKELDLYSHKAKYPSQLSGGQAQRVAIARTWVLKPDILLLDEPTSSLDAITKEGIQDILKRHQSEQQKTTVIVTHSIEEAVYLGQTVMLMHKGKVIKEITNESYGLDNARNQIDFYNKVIEIREAFQEVQSYANL